MDKQITLLEAFKGFKFSIKHLDGREVVIENPKGKVIKPGEVLTASDLGMPCFHQPYKFGNLFITFSIKFPELSLAHFEAIREVLPSSSNEIDKTAEGPYKMSDYKGPELNTGSPNKEEQNEESDEEDNPRGQKVQCQQQ